MCLSVTCAILVHIVFLFVFARHSSVYVCARFSDFKSESVDFIDSYSCYFPCQTIHVAALIKQYKFKRYFFWWSF